jgi:hypothetical protein
MCWNVIGIGEGRNRAKIAGISKGRVEKAPEGNRGCWFLFFIFVLSVAHGAFLIVDTTVPPAFSPPPEPIDSDGIKVDKKHRRDSSHKAGLCKAILHERQRLY